MVGGPGSAARRLAPRAIGVLWALGGLLPLVTLVWAASASGDLPPLPADAFGPRPLGPFLVVHTVLFVPMAFVGASLAVRPGAPPIAWVMLLVGAANGVGWFASVYATEALVRSPGSLPLGEAAAVLAASQHVAQMLVGVLAVPMLPTGRLPTGRMRLVLVPAATVATLGVLDMFLAPGPLFFFAFLENPIAPPGALGDLVEATALPDWVWPVSLTPIAVWLLIVARAEPEAGRRRILQRVAGTTLFISFGFVALFTSDAQPIAWLITVAFLIVLTDVTVFAARRERLWGMPSLVHRTALWVVSSTLVALVYGAVILVALSAGAGVAGWERVVALAVGLGAAAVAQSALDAWLRRRIVGQGEDPGPALDRVRRALAGPDGVRDAPRIVVDAAVRAVRGARVVLDLVIDGRAVRIAAGGAAAGSDRLAIPVVHGGAAAGLVAVLLPDGEELDEAERRLLVAIVAAAAPALAAWRERAGDVTVRVERLAARLDRMAGELRGLDELGAAAGAERLDAVHAETAEMVGEVRALAHALAGREAQALA